MEFLPTELLVNIFARLNIVDANSCRLLNRRYNEVLKKNAKSMKRPSGMLGIWISPKKKHYNVSLKSLTNPLRTTNFNIHPDKIEVFGHRNELAATLLSKQLGVVDTDNVNKRNNIVKYCGILEALKVIVHTAQLKNSIDTLEQKDVEDSDILKIIISQLPRESVQNLIFVRQYKIERILGTINQIGPKCIKYIRLEADRLDATLSVDTMDFLLTQVPRVNLNIGPYFVSLPSVKTVMENWLQSDWVISLYAFSFSASPSDWRKLIILLNMEREFRVLVGIDYVTEVYRLTRNSDDHILHIKVVYIDKGESKNIYVKSKLYENEMYKNKDCIL